MAGAPLVPWAAYALCVAPLLLLAGFLYSRVARGKTDLSVPRRRLLEELDRSPLSSATELAGRTGLHANTVRYHLDVLVRQGRIVARHVAGERRFSVAGDPRAAPLAAAIAAGKPRARLLAAVEARPGLSLRDVALATGLRYTTAHYHAQQLAGNGRLRAVRVAREVRLFSVSPRQALPEER
jgi:predicted transcriptional regulator